MLGLFVLIVKFVGDLSLSFKNADVILSCSLCANVMRVV